MSGPEAALALEMAAATDVGRLRQRNEDALQVLPEAGAAILADGMGGHQAGDEASRLAVEVIAEAIQHHDPDSQPALAQWLNAANRAILARAAADPACQGMGATVVVAIRRGARLLFTHLGDSRLYRLQDGALAQLTEDHTLAQQYINEGRLPSVEAGIRAGRNLLLKGLGIEPTVMPETDASPLQAGQTYLLCSDGLTDPVGDAQITDVLSHPDYSAGDAARTLVDLANANGGPDNISVIVLRIHGSGE